MKHIYFFCFFCFIGCASTFKESSVKLTEPVTFQSKSGQIIFTHANSKNDFFKLANNFTFQPNKILCGPTTISIILNTVLKKTQLDNKEAPYVYFHDKDIKHVPSRFNPRIRRFTARNVLNETTQSIKSSDIIFGKKLSTGRDIGLQLSQLSKMFNAYGVSNEKYVVKGDMTFEQVKKLVVDGLSSESKYIVVNYARKILKQRGGGHISPLGAYDEKTDSVLIMDVNPSKADWVWVSLEQLYQAMKTYDTKENRGFLIIKA